MRLYALLMHEESGDGKGLTNSAISFVWPLVSKEPRPNFAGDCSASELLKDANYLFLYVREKSYERTYVGCCAQFRAAG